MTARLTLIALTGLALAIPAAAADGYELKDVLVTGLREGRVVATGRTDSRGGFRLEFPAGPYPADQICFNGPSVRAGADYIRYGDDNETLLRRSGGRLSGSGAEPQRAETLVELLMVIAVNDRPQGPEERLVVPGARIRAGQARSADLDLCYRPFVNVAGGQRPGDEPPTIRRGAAGPQTSLPGAAGPAQAETSEPVYVRNADGTYSILELMRTNPDSNDAGSGGPGRQAGGTVTGRETNAAGAPENALRATGGPASADVTGDGARIGDRDLDTWTRERIRPDDHRSERHRVGPGIPPPSARPAPAAPVRPQPVVVTGTVSLVEGRR